MAGYFGIGVYHPLKSVNIGTLYRSAYCFGASFIFTIGKKYHNQSSDTVNSWKHIPLFNYLTLEDFRKSIPSSCLVIGIEQTNKSKQIHGFSHPKQAIYLLGTEDTGLPDIALKACQDIIEIPSKQCLNVAVAGSIVMFDRLNKTKTFSYQEEI